MFLESKYILSALVDHAQIGCPAKVDTVQVFGYVCLGTTPLDEVVQLRQNRIVRIDLALGSVLLCLRRRCAFRGHLELKVDRYVANAAGMLQTPQVCCKRSRYVANAAGMWQTLLARSHFQLACCEVLVFIWFCEQCIVPVAGSMPAIPWKTFDRQPLMSYMFKQVHGVEPDMA